MADDFSFLDEPTNDERAQALTAALRRQQIMGIVGQLSGDKVLSGVGGGLIADAQNRTQAAADANKSRLVLAMQAKRDASEQQYRQSQEQHQRKQEELQAQLIGQGKYAQGQFGVLNTRTGQLDPYGKPDKNAATGGVTQNQLDTAFDNMAKHLSTAEGRSHLAPDMERRLGAIERVRDVILDENGNIRPLSPSQVNVVGSDMASVIAGGGVPSEHQIEEQNPHTWRGSLAKTLQWATNNPQDAGAQEFLKSNLELLKTVEGGITKKMRAYQIQQLPNSAHLRKIAKDRYDNLLKSNNVFDIVDPDTGLQLPEKGAASAGGNINLEDPPTAKVTPSGKPYVKMQQNPKTKAVRYLDANGNMVE